MKRLIKSETIKEKFNVNRLEYGDRKGPFVYIDNNILIGDSEDIHRDLLNDYLNLDFHTIGQYRSGRTDIPIAFGHLMEDQNDKLVAVIENDCLFNVDINTVVKTIKEKCPQISEVFSCNCGRDPNEELKKVANLIKKFIKGDVKMKRLIQAETIKQKFKVNDLDLGTREGVFVYLNGDVLIDTGLNAIHSDLANHLNSEQESYQWNRASADVPCAFGNIAKDKKTKQLVAVIEGCCVFNVDVNTVAQAIKKQHPEILEVYFAKFTQGNQELTKLANLIKKFIKGDVKMRRLISKQSNRHLIKKSLMNIQMLEGTIDQLGDQGRNILKSIEEFKFKLEQAARIVTNDQQLTQKLLQKRKILDQSAGQIYAIVFDLENLDITQIYQQQQLMMNQGPQLDVDQTNTVPTPTEEHEQTEPEVDVNEEEVEPIENEISEEEEEPNTEEELPEEETQENK